MELARDCRKICGVPRFSQVLGIHHGVGRVEWYTNGGNGDGEQCHGGKVSPLTGAPVVAKWRELCKIEQSD
jgi:hypothetical protein